MPACHPLVPAQILGDRLRAARLACSLSIQEASTFTSVTATELDRIEHGQMLISDPDVASLYGAYRIHDLRHQADLLASANHVRDLINDPWWVEYTHTTSDPTATSRWLHQHADHILDVAIMTIPQPLRTRAYARALHHTAEHTGAAAEHPSTDATNHPHRRDGPAHTALIDEAALRRPVGGPDIHRDQLLHLLHLARTHILDLRVLPLIPHAGLTGSFTRWTFPDRPPVYGTTNTITSAFFEDHANHTRFATTLAAVTARALTADQSLRLVTSLT
jgi:transcriptional regulator with XRE-family HTH domain